MKWLSKIIGASVLSLCALPAAAQVVMPHDDGAKPMVVAESDRVAIGPIEYVPRFARLLPNSLTVAAGQTVTLEADSTFDAIEVAGILRCARDRDTRLRVTHLLVLVGGRFDCGTTADPVLRKVEIIIRDVAFDFERDPFQWSNGIVNFGAQTRVGAKKTAFVELSVDAAAKATTLTLATMPENWQAGDELLLPDTRQIESFQDRAPLRREAPLTIVSVAPRAGGGATLTLSKPLNFEHASIRDADGTLVLRPRVANLTRNIVIRSENAAGTPGHTVNISAAATWDIQYNELRGLGRTKAEPLNNTSVDMMGLVNQIGTNQIAKYADHDHHTGTSNAVRQKIGNSIVGGRKWGHVTHVAFDGLIQDNVCVDLVGACFVTEDGYEARNTFRGNFAAYVPGVHTRGTGCIEDNNPGCEGAGFWFRGPKQIIEGNESWNNNIGISLFNREFIGTGSRFPSVKGGVSDTVANGAYLNAQTPLSLKGNVTSANKATGLEYWSLQERFPATDHVAANNGARQAWIVNSGNNRLHLVNSKLVAQGGLTDCINSSAGYTGYMEIDGGYIGGCDSAIHRGGAIHLLRLSGVTLQNKRNIALESLPRNGALFENLTHKKLGAFPEQFIVMGDTTVWAPGQPPTNTANNGLWMVQRGSRFVVKNWQGTGQDYLLFTYQQKPDAAAWPASDANRDVLVPEAGLTMSQSWDKYGMAYLGDVARNPVPLTGLVNGFARSGLAIAFGPPRSVVTFPNILAPAVVTNNTVTLRLTLTGDPAAANACAGVQVDGLPATRHCTPPQGAGEDQRRSVTAAIAPGAHTVTTWRENAAGTRIAASEMKFQYFVGTAPPPPPPPPPPVNCSQGPYAVESVTPSPWVTSGENQTRTITTVERRETLVYPENGGTPCGDSVRTTTTTETRPVWMNISAGYTLEKHVEAAQWRVCPVGTNDKTQCVIVD